MLRDAVIRSISNVFYAVSNYLVYERLEISILFSRIIDIPQINDSNVDWDCVKENAQKRPDIRLIHIIRIVINYRRSKYSVE